MKSKRRENNNIGPATGWQALLHRTVMFILFPLRKPLIFFPLLLIMFLAPTFRGVKPAEVHSWYWKQITSAVSAVVDYIAVYGKKALPQEFKLNFMNQEATQSTEKGIDKLVDYPTVDVNANRRAMFEKASGAPQVVDIIIEKPQVQDDDLSEVKEESSESVQDKEDVDTMSDKGLVGELPEFLPHQSEDLGLSPQEAPTPQMPQDFKAPQISQPQTFPEKKPLPLQEEVSEAPLMGDAQSIRKNLPLVYLDKPEEIIGMAKVQNANELEVDGKYIFLYGVYVNPETEKGLEAQKFLEKYVKNHVVRCEVVAYTTQNVATGLCYIGSDNLNRLLVIQKYSKNVAL